MSHTPTNPPALTTICRFYVGEPVAVLGIDLSTYMSTPHPIPGLLDTTIQGQGNTAEEMWADVLGQARALGLDVAPLEAIVSRYMGPAADYQPEGYEPPAWLLTDPSAGGLCVFVSVLLDTGIMPVVPALAPFVRYTERTTELQRQRGPIQVEQVMVPYMAQDERDSWRASEIEISELRPMQRITLHPSAHGTSIILASGGPTDEGYNFTEEVIEQSEDEHGAPVWEIQGSNESSDCDGRMSRGWHSYSLGGPRGPVSAWFPTMDNASAETDRDAWRRDHAAEAAGY